ncbi:MAG: response regulator [Phycisphaeraceae bacterium]|nr:response regulator [Phycisphaeraceae bacterium]MCW5755497.1 response regulator [Phycisphaeraceae bacterium]
MAQDKDVLTTGEVARICNVAPRTVSKWFDTGQLKGYRIPGSKDRRIPMSELVRFMRQHGIPMEGLHDGSLRVLIADPEREVVDVLERVLSQETNYRVATATNAFAAGFECERFKPHVLLLDLHLDERCAKDILATIRNNDALQMTRVIAMSGKLTDGQAQSIRAQGYDAFLKKPFQVRQVVQAIEKSSALAA